jgi:hypothetical protein
VREKSEGNKLKTKPSERAKARASKRKNEEKNAVPKPVNKSTEGKCDLLK